MKANGSFLGNRAWHQILNLATVLAIVLAGAQGTAFAQGKGRSPQKVVADTGSAKNARLQRGGQQEAVRVHGDWTITIRNADHSVASRHEFENALVDPGLLAKLLAHGGTAFNWQVVLGGGVCFHSIIGASTCLIAETTGLPDSSSLSNNLVVTAPTAGPHANALVLEGSIKASLAGQISQVDTSMAICSPGSLVTAGCQSIASSNTTFTQKGISSLNINVQAGQTIDVKVVISFS